MNKQARLICCICGKQSEPFTILLQEDKHTWEAEKQFPGGWSVGEETELFFYNEKGLFADYKEAETGTIFAYCADCEKSEERKKIKDQPKRRLNETKRS